MLIREIVNPCWKHTSAPVKNEQAGQVESTVSTHLSACFDFFDWIPVFFSDARHIAEGENVRAKCFQVTLVHFSTNLVDDAVQRRLAELHRVQMQN